MHLIRSSGNWNKHWWQQWHVHEHVTTQFQHDWQEPSSTVLTLNFLVDKSGALSQRVGQFLARTLENHVIHLYTSITKACTVMCTVHNWSEYSDRMCKPSVGTSNIARTYNVDCKLLFRRWSMVTLSILHLLWFHGILNLKNQTILVISQQHYMYLHTM